jgi:leucyl aminopeptidase
MLTFSSVSRLEDRKQSDALVIPFWKATKAAEYAVPCKDYKPLIKAPITTHDFKGCEGETYILYPNSKKEQRIIMLGLGKKKDATVEHLRRAYSALTKFCSKKKGITTLSLLLPEVKELSTEETIRGMSEGMLLSNYLFHDLKNDSIKKDAPIPLKKATFIGATAKETKIATKAKTICEGVYFARDLVNGNACDITPTALAKHAKKLATQHSRLTTKVLTRKQCEKLGMGLFLAVALGAAEEPAFIVMEYKGNARSKDKTVVIGKGVTYDSGGLNLKPSGHIEDMKSDMAGAAAAFGTMKAVATLKLPINLAVVVAATENNIDAKSYKPGDVYTAMTGKTVEIGNTDAEGRLTLADALAYTCANLAPSRIIDLATLTGAMEIALGNEAAGLFSNDDKLADALYKASEATFERVWRLPLFKEFNEQLKSDVADINNIGGRAGGSITAALFLQEFLKDKKTPWTHLDIAGVAYLSKGRRYLPKNATGVGVRLLVEFLESL